MNLRKTFANFFLKPELDRLRALTESAVNDWRMVPYLQARDPQELINQLAEVDSRLVDMLVRQIRDYSADTSETFRLQIVKECRSLYLNDPVTQFAVELWTDYAFSESPDLTAVDKAAQETWNEFWQADRNAPILGERKLHKRSEDLLSDGELFFVVFASKSDGQSTVRMIPTEQIKGIVRDPSDSSVVLYYKRESTGADGFPDTVYYKDWHATDEQLARAKLPTDAKRAEDLQQETDVEILHAAFREVSGRGWPLATASVDWTREYKQFLQNRAAVARAAATFVEKIKAKTGQRGLDAMKRALGTSLTGSNDAFERNPPPVAGSTWLENDAVERSWMNRPTNSGDAEVDGTSILTQAGLGYKLYPHYLGKGDAFRLATATSMEGPTLKSFNRYQAFWSSVWKDLFKIVVGFAEEYSGKSFSSHEATVSIDRILTLSIEDVTAELDNVTSLFDRGIIDQPTAERLSTTLIRTGFEAMGIQGVNEMFDVQTAEAGDNQSPFVRISEDGQSDYGLSIRRAFYALWSGKLDKAGFASQMEDTIDRGLRRAWKEGMESVGLELEDMTTEEELELGTAILDQYSYIDGVADFIDSNSKANDGKLATIQPRGQMWVNRYKEMQNRARAMAKSDPKLRWDYSPEKEHCDSCLKLNGIVKRASFWNSKGIIPAVAGADYLDCGGWQCGCTLTPTDEPVKKGPLPRLP